MKIESYVTEMASTSVSMRSFSFKESVVASNGNGALADNTDAAGDQPNQNNRAAILALSPEAQSQNRNGPLKINAANGAQGVVLADRDMLKLNLIQRMVEAITGKKYNFNVFNGFNGGPQPLNNNIISLVRPGQDAQPQPTTVTVQKTAEYYEFQQMSFQAKGLVNTSDGRQIQFDINALASYEFSSSQTILTQAVRLTDPLVINFNGALPEFTKDRYAFDLTIDGLTENIYMPTNGSGFLALDKDGNGKIDDGSELFGASTGDGFWELSAYDEDGNGWIDEGDSVFEKLKLMSVDKDTGEHILVSLKDSGVGAIFLGSTAANYQIKGDGNELMGVVRKNGVFLNENGSAGTIHHIDLTY